MEINTYATQQADNGNVEGLNIRKAGGAKIELPGTFDELQMLLQTEGDRRVSQALKTASEKWQKEMQEALDAEKNEAERLLVLTLEKREKKALEVYTRELEEKEKLLKYKELEIKIMYILSENKLPLEFKDLVFDRDEGTALKRADILCTLWRKKLEEAKKEH